MRVCIIPETLLQVRGQRQLAPPDHHLRPDLDTITEHRRRTRAEAGPTNTFIRMGVEGAELDTVMRQCTAQPACASDHGHRVPLGSRRCVNVTIDLITMKWVHVKISPVLLFNHFPN